MRYWLGNTLATTTVVALALVGRRRWSTEQVDQHERRYTQAVEQLGSASAAVRVGGLYALERLGTDDPAQQATIGNVLCAYLRMPERRDPAEHEVRQTALDILIQHHDDRRPAHWWLALDLSLQRADLSGMDLTDANLTGSLLNEANLSNAQLAGANLTWSDVIAADLSGAGLDGADLSYANLSYADLTGARLHHAKLVETDLTRAVLTRASLFLADLSDARLVEADLSNADVVGADLTGAHLSGADLTGATVADAYGVPPELVPEP